MLSAQALVVATGSSDQGRTPGGTTFFTFRHSAGVLVVAPVLYHDEMGHIYIS